VGLGRGRANQRAYVGVRVWSGFGKRARSSKRMCWWESVEWVWEAGALIEAHVLVWE
jgi:hypothetical protein